MVNLSKAEYGLSLLGAFVVGVAVVILIGLVRKQITESRRFKIEQEQAWIETQRALIRAEVESALGVGSDEEIDPDDFEEDDDAGSNRP